MEFIDHFQNNIGNIVDTIASVPRETTQIDVCKIIVGTAFLGGNTYFWWRGMVVDLDPETTDKLFGFLTIKRFFLYKSYIYGNARYLAQLMPDINSNTMN